MIRVGIEKLRVYPCTLALSLTDLCAARDQDPAGIADTMMIDERSINPLYEDPVTMAVNAAVPMLSEQDRQSVELLIVASESGVDQEKPLSTWVHRYLGLPDRCRNFELKHACYGGTAALGMAAGWLASGLAGGAKALVITTDQSRMHLGKPYEFVMGAGAVAMLVSTEPRFAELELGHSGYFSIEVSDLTRPTSLVETGNSETSLLSYLDGLDGAYSDYLTRAGDIDFDTYFTRNVYHAPFGGMTFLAHKELLRRAGDVDRETAWAHFRRKSLPALRYVRRMGGTYSSSTFIGLLGAVDGLSAGNRIGIYSYGSGSCAEMYSVLVGDDADEVAAATGLDTLLDYRRRLTVDEYEALERSRTALIDQGDYEIVRDDWYEQHYHGTGALVLEGMSEYYRRYRWS